MPDVLSTESWGKPLPASLTERNQDLEYVLEFAKKSNTYREPFLHTWHELMDNYLVVPTGMSRRAIPYLGYPGLATNPQPFVRQRSRLKDPETHQIVEALAAQYLGLMFGVRDYLQARPLGFDDPEKARVLSRILMSVLEGPGVFQTLYQSFKDAGIVGTSYLEFGWESRTRQQVTEVPVLDENGEVIAFTFVPMEVPYREGPMIRQVDGWDFYPDPSGTRIGYDMIGCAKRFRITQAQAERLAEAGKWDKEATKRAIEKNGHDKKLEASEGERFDDYARSLPDKLNTGIGIEYWGFCPYKHADKFSNRVITVYNGELVRSTGNPFMTGEIPFEAIVNNPIAGRHYGFSESEANRFLQDSIDNALMNLTDAGDLIVRPAMLAGSTFGGHAERVQNRGLNDVIPCNNPDALVPIPTNLQSIGVMQAEHQRRKLQARESSGMTNPMLGIGERGDETATATSERIRLGSQRIMVKVLLWERTIFPRSARFIHSMLRQFTDMDEGGIAVLNGEPMPFSIRDIDYDADVRFVGSSQSQSKFQTNAQLTSAITAIGSSMQLIPIIPELFIRLLRDGNDIPDAEQILQRAVVTVQQMQAAQALQQSASPPKGVQPSMGTETGAMELEGRRVA